MDKSTHGHKPIRTEQTGIPAEEIFTLVQKGLQPSIPIKDFEGYLEEACNNEKEKAGYFIFVTDLQEFINQFKNK